MTATVNATSSAAVTVDASDTKISTGITKETIEALPRGTTFSSLLALSPGIVAQPAGGGFQIDGATGSENVFVVDGQEVTNFRAGSLGSFNYLPPKTIKVAADRIRKPELPNAVDPGPEGVLIQVAILVDENGKVYAARAPEGDERFRRSAEKAAMGSRFTPAARDGVPLKMSGVLAYHFRNKDEVDIAVADLKVIYPEKLRRRLTLKEKLHFWIYDVLVKSAKGSAKRSEYESRFVRSGKASVRVRVKDLSDTVVYRLEQAGLEVDSVKGETVSGRIEVGKIAALAELEEVTYISP